MKKLCFKGLALFALIIVLAACSNPSDTPPNNPNPPLSISGKFTNGGKTSYFTAQENSVTRAAAAQVPLSGTLVDGDISFALKGFYDEESGAFTLSAASSMIKYSISGNSSTGATASIATRTNTENLSDPPIFGKPIFAQVSTEVSGDELAGAITGNEEPQEPVPGFDQQDCWGVWYDDTYEGIKYIVSDWGIVMAYQEEDGTWTDGTNFGFAEIEKNGNVFDVVADYTTIAWAPPRDSNEFPAYLEEQGYQVIPQGIDNFPQAEAQSLFPLHENDGYFAIDETDASTYEVYVGYNGNEEWDDLYGTQNPEKPYYIRMLWDNRNSHFDFERPANNLPAAFATFDDTIAGAQDVIDYMESSGGNETPPDLKAAILEKLGPGYSNAGILLGVEVNAYRTDNPMPMPNGEDDPNMDEIAEQQKEWSIAYENWLAEKLHEYFPETYPDAKILIQHGWKYNDMLQEWTGNPFDNTPVTRYIKWNVSLVGGKLTAKAYRSGEPNSETYPNYLDDPAYYSDEFAGTSSLTIPSTQTEQNTLDNGCVTTMVR